jgi:hypothetical protein
MRAAAHLTAIGLSAAILAISRSPSAGAAETNCAPLPPPIGSYSIARITVDRERDMAFIYTLEGDKLAVDRSGDLVVWVIKNQRQPRPEPTSSNLMRPKSLLGKRPSPVVAQRATGTPLCLAIVPSECTDDGGRRAMGLLRSHRLSAVVG